MMTDTRLAIVGIGLRYPDASSPDELWDNVLAGRRAFRTLPDERMNLADYWSDDPAEPDRFYTRKAAVLRDFEFDRLKYRVPGSTFRSTDMTHWLALDVAAQALADAGFRGGDGLPKASTGVVIGNSLTGEFARANLMRLRWPYARRTVAAALSGKGWQDADIRTFLADLEKSYKAPFPPIDEDTLAGGLANTIAGRICNYFDLGGGGYTVDGACSSSLLSIATAAKSLATGELDVALAGGVDLSIDPFEVIGFAKTGALATREMKVYDRDSNGFWPGEGSGVVVMMREDEAAAQGKRIYALVTGWGVSSDGKGGITRPQASGHRRAIARAYDRAGYDVSSVSYFEGHGTGTALGDATEIEALSTARRQADPAAPKAALSTIKGNFGHTKAAAGVAGLIKAVLSVQRQIIPPGTGQSDPHPLLLTDEAAMFVPRQANLWPQDMPIRAGVSAMGFGGINTHIAIEQPPAVHRITGLPRRVIDLVAGRQDYELLLLDAADIAGLREQAENLAALTAKLSFAELSDLAYTLTGALAGRRLRAAIVTASPDDASRKLNQLAVLLGAGQTQIFAPKDGIFAGMPAGPPKIAFLFPGQGSGSGEVGAIRSRFPIVESIFGKAGVSTNGDQVATEIAQPRIVAGSLAAMRVLESLGITANTAVGHSLGELTALSWGGAMDGSQLLRLASLRGKVMAAASRGGGTMAGLATTPEKVRHLANGSVVIAGYNGPRQTVISGAVESVELVCKKAAAEGITATRIGVSHAFHSPFVRPAADAMTERLAEMTFRPLTKAVFSTVTGHALDGETDVRALLRTQVLEPVRFHAAAARAVADVDLAVEAGPGRVLAGLLSQISPDTPVLSVDTDSASLKPLFAVVGAAYTSGVCVDTTTLFAGRGVKSLPLNGRFTFLASPCENAPDISAELIATTGAVNGDHLAAARSDTDAHDASTLELLCRLAADRVELPLAAVGPDTHPLDDLHLSSITVGEIVNQVTRELGRPALAATPNFATVRFGELADIIDQLAETAIDGEDNGTSDAAGVAPWVRSFAVSYVERASTLRDLDIGAPTDDWAVFAPEGHPLAEPMRTALAGAGIGAGVVLCLPPDCDESHAKLFLDAGRAALTGSNGTRFVVVQQGLGASGLARTLHLEDPSAPTTTVDLADVMADDPEIIRQSVARVVSEVANTSDFTEVRYDITGRRLVRELTAVPPSEPGPLPLTNEDVMLVTGGGKGITAECAMTVAKESGAKLILVGRGDPEADGELSANLARFDAAGVRSVYMRADVTSAAQVAEVLTAAQARLGTITAILHGAGRNEPEALHSLTEEKFRATLAPKVGGLRAVLDAVDTHKIKLLVTFGSIIGRAGLRGEAHYATANDWLTELTSRFGEEHPNARAIALEWSVWSGTGMGERLGVVEALSREGITPISLDDGISILRQVLGDLTLPPILVVSGRTGGPPTLKLDHPSLPLLRFVERVVVHYPEIELITEADLSLGSDPYLADHLLDGDLLVPAVIGMEAMTQVASALTGHSGSPLLQNVEFLRPIVVRPEGSTTVRIAALAVAPGAVDVVIRSKETGFGVDHFRATLRWPQPGIPSELIDGAAGELPAVPVDPAAELYGGIMFQGKRFQRLLGYRLASARHAVANIEASRQAGWFAAFVPQTMLLADPGTRDVAMHALQCCIPDATLLPERVERLYLARPTQEIDYVILDGREQCQNGDSYTYDVDLFTPSGELVERWQGLTLRAVRRNDGAGPWVPAMLGAYLERCLEQVLGGTRAVTVEPDPAQGVAGTAERRAQTRLALSRALGKPVEVRYRPDGKPEVDGAWVSASHGAQLTLGVAGSQLLGCDVEPAVSRSDGDWAALIGDQQLAARDMLLDIDSAAVANTRIWTALECLRKTGATTQSLTVGEVGDNGWVVLAAGGSRIATWVTRVDGRPDPVVFAVLGRQEAYR